MYKFTYFVCCILLLKVCSGAHTSPTEKHWQEKRQRDSIALIQQQQSLQYTDSMLTQLHDSLGRVLPLFYYEKVTNYEDHGRYVHPLLRTERNTGRCYLQVYMSDNGGLSLKSHYVGSRTLNATQLMLQCDSTYIQFSGALYQFSIESHYETLTISEKDAEHILQFIDEHSRQRVRIILHNDHQQYAYILSDTDKQSLQQTLALYRLFSDIRQLERAQRQYSLQIEKYQRRASR